MRLLLVRHGETEENVGKVWQGHLPGKLSEKGVRQAQKLADHLKDEKIDAIFSSDLARAADTAKEIAKFHPHTPFHLVEDLREADMGPYTGTSRKIDFSERPKDIESQPSMLKRGKKFIENVYKNYPEGTVLFVAHGGMNWVIMNSIQPLATENQHNASLNIIEWKGEDASRVHLRNNIEHLK